MVADGGVEARQASRVAVPKAGAPLRPALDAEIVATHGQRDGLPRIAATL